MDKYYKILGIPNSATKEEIKKAYLKKIKALHPDKVHGTALEDTATFLSAEINEAYNTLMKQFQNKKSPDTNNDSIFFEQDIYIENNGLLQYSLSNDLGLIQKALYKRTGSSDMSFIDKFGWQLNPYLSENVKKVMLKLNVTYSMTHYFDNQYETVILNKLENGNWFITGYELEIKYSTENIQKEKNYSYSTKKRKKSYNLSKYINFVLFAAKQIIKATKFIMIAIFIIFIFSQVFSGQPSRTNTVSQIQFRQAAPVYATVTNAEWLNVRSSPSSVSDSNKVTQIRRGTRVEILERYSNMWVRIRYNNGQIGYAHSNFLTR